MLWPSMKLRTYTGSTSNPRPFRSLIRGSSETEPMSVSAAVQEAQGRDPASYGYRLSEGKLGDGCWCVMGSVARAMSEGCFQFGPQYPAAHMIMTMLMYFTCIPIYIYTYMYIISYHIISYHIISYHIISYHIISYHIISYHIISYHIISYHIISYHTVPYHTITYHTIPYHIISCHIISNVYRHKQVRAHS